MKLKDVDSWIWVRLIGHPDKFSKYDNPTLFEVSHSPTGEVFTRDSAGSPSFRVSGKERAERWLNTEVKEIT